jgi:hypothetical protein
MRRSTGLNLFVAGALALPLAAQTAAEALGTAALGVSPRVGHIHVTVDGASWHWADASGVPVIVQGRPPGPHKILVQLVNADHKPIDQGIVEVTVPDVSTRAEAR